MITTTTGAPFTRSLIAGEWAIARICDPFPSRSAQSFAALDTLVGREMVSSRIVDPERKKFLQGRFRKAASAQPDLKALKQLLLKFGGEYLVAPPMPDADIPGGWPTHDS